MTAHKRIYYACQDCPAQITKGKRCLPCASAKIDSDRKAQRATARDRRRAQQAPL